VIAFFSRSTRSTDPLWPTTPSSLGVLRIAFATADPLPSAARVIEELQACSHADTEIAAPPAQRLLRLRSRRFESAAVSGRLELLPARVSPARAVKTLAGRALLGAARA